jgi:ankyrin repeat protein
LCAAVQGDDARVANLLSQGANPNVTDDLQSTPLHWAAQGGHDRVIPLLIAAGANLKARNVKKLVPQDVAAGRAKTNKDCWRSRRK